MRASGHFYLNERYLANWWKRSQMAEDGCWEWQGPVSEFGYAFVGFRGQVMAIHRAAYLLFFGALPLDYEVHHLCKKRRCWRPDHLQCLTDAEHQLVHRPKNDFCPHGHEFTPENSKIDPKMGTRQCRVCCRAKARAWRKEHPESHRRYEKNRRDRERAGKPLPDPGRCKHGHPWDEVNTYVNPKTRLKFCRACQRECQNRSKQAKH